MPKRAGPVGGNEAQAGYRWQSEPQGVRDSGAAERREKFVCNQVCRTRAAKPTLVVKISDTSRHGKAGSIPAFDARTGMRPRKGLHAARRSLASTRSKAVLLSLTPISTVPQRAQRLPMRKHRHGGGEDVWYFVPSKPVPARAATASSVPRRPSPRSVVKIAVTSTDNREVAGSNPARRHVRR